MNKLKVKSNINCNLGMIDQQYALIITHLFNNAASQVYRTLPEDGI
jgi:hypothetical protein